MQTKNTISNKHKTPHTINKPTVLQYSSVCGFKRKKVVGIAIAIPTLYNVADNENRPIHSIPKPAFRNKQYYGNYGNRTKYSQKIYPTQTTSDTVNHGKNGLYVNKQAQKKKCMNGSAKTNSDHMDSKPLTKTPRSSETIEAVNVSKPQPSTSPDTPDSLDNTIKQQQSSKDDTSKNQEPVKPPTTNFERLVIPKKHIIRNIRQGPTVPDLPQPVAPVKGVVSCPYCHCILDLKKSRILSKAFKKDARKNKKYQKGQTAQATEQKNVDAMTTMNNIKRPISLKEICTFCQTHEIELKLKPQGIKNGWLEVIMFDTLKYRIHGLKQELDMVISRSVGSIYRDLALKAYKNLGMNKARSIDEILARLHTFLPGYYGIRGAAEIQIHLADMYLHPGLLDNHTTSPQRSMEYLQQVLVPEVGFRLIRQDLINKDKTMMKDPDIDQLAQNVMAQSAVYGEKLQQMDDWTDSLDGDRN